VILNVNECVDIRLNFHILFIRIYRLILNSLSFTGLPSLLMVYLVIYHSILLVYFINRLFGFLIFFSTQEKDQPPISYLLYLYAIPILL
jgi:hypothetical protein